MQLKKFQIVDKIFIGWGILWICITMLLFEYVDCRSITVWSYNILDLFFSGNLIDFYEYSFENIRGAAHVVCAGNFLPFIPLAIWNLPAWLINNLFEKNELGIFALFWTKTFWLVLLFNIVYVMKKICGLLTENKEGARYISLLMFGSCEVVLSIAYAGQDEVLYLLIFLWGLYNYLLEKKFQFYVLSIMSVSFCPIMLLPYFLLVIASDKNILSICSKLIIAFLPTVFFNTFYMNSIRFRYKISAGDNYLWWFFGQSTLNTGWGLVSIVAVFVCILFMHVYFNKPMLDSRKSKCSIVFYLAILMTTLSFLGWDQYYRAFLWLPFLLLCVVKEKSVNFKTTMFLLGLLECMRGLLNYISKKAVLFQIGNLSTIGKHLLEKNNTNSISAGIFHISENSQFYFFLTSIALAVVCYIFTINILDEKGHEYKLEYSEYVALAVYYMVVPSLICLFFFEIII